MAAYTINLIPGGFEILADGVPWVVQTTMPGLPGNDPIPDDQRQTVAQAFLDQITGNVRTIPELVITAVTPDGGHASACVVELPEVTCPLGTTLSLAGEVRVGGQKVPVSGHFRAPIRASDGRERVVLAVITAGSLAATWTPSESGIWEVTEALINRDLPEASRFHFSGVKVYVLDL